MSPAAIPNIISAARILMVPPAVWLMFTDRFGGALLIFVLAAVSDGLDGYLARHHGWSSRLGSILDPLADKLLMVATYLTLAWLGHLPIWLAMAVIGRDGVILAGASAYHLFLGRYDMAPSSISKFNTVAQALLVVAILWHLGPGNLPPAALEGLMALVLVTTLASGADYVWTWGHHAMRRGRDD